LDPPDFGRLRDDRHRSGRKTLAQRAKSGDLEVKRQATWGMSVRRGSLCASPSNGKRLAPTCRQLQSPEID
ncbi:hypothetical protein, partial [Gemmobacter caeruleus]|uniref:hypothetical protein n=1 Tax=Gemmobacter caeruleus TaxID=2595004 RepID=UPI00193AB7E4